ncbi:MAG: RNA polymerase sigma factor [Dermatophilaceae bacterium]
MSEARLDSVWRRETPHVLAALARRYGRFDDAEDAVQEALLAAATQWPRDGVPENPRGWLVRVASRRLVDVIRTETARRAREERDALLTSATDGVADAARGRHAIGTVPDVAASDAATERDDTVQVMLLCCHPALSRASQVALILRAVAGLTAAEIAAGFLVPPATMAQRISRAKATLRQAGEVFPDPAPADRPARLVAVRHALALLFTEGHTRTSGPQLTDGILTREAVRLARELVAATPRDSENAGLLALFLLTGARAAARTDSAGDLVPLDRQDRSRWDRTAIAEGVRLLERALPTGPVGEFQLRAAVAAVHAEVVTAAETDWPQIAELYRMLDAVAPSPAVTIGRAAAVAEVDGPQAGLALLATLDGTPGAARNHRFHAVRGHLLRRAGRAGDADAALTRAAGLTRSIPEQRYLARLVRESVGVEPSNSREWSRT